jgi:hypothetical protein
MLHRISLARLLSDSQRMVSDSAMSMKQWTRELLLMLAMFSVVEAFTPTDTKTNVISFLMTLDDPCECSELHGCVR